MVWQAFLDVTRETLFSLVGYPPTCYCPTYGAEQ